MSIPLKSQDEVGNLFPLLQYISNFSLCILVTTRLIYLSLNLKIAESFHFFSTYLILVYVLVTTTLIYLSLNLTIAESFYCINYGSSIITSKIRQIIWGMKHCTGIPEKWYFKNGSFGILIHVLSRRQQKHQCLCFHHWDYLTNFWS